MKYIVKFHDGHKVYSRKDLYMDDDNEGDSQMNGTFMNGDTGEDMDTSDNDSHVSGSDNSSDEDD